jgi:hypothetical protein
LEQRNQYAVINRQMLSHCQLLTVNRRLVMDELILSAAELPEAMRAWLAARPAVVVSIEQLEDDRVVVRSLPEITPEIVARARVTLAKYREALMNLT